MLYTYRKTGETLILQGNEFGTITTQNGTAEIALTGSPILLEEGNEFRIAVAQCDAQGAFVACLVAHRSKSRELMEFMARKTKQEFQKNGIAIFVESIDAAKRTVAVRIRPDKPIVLKSNGKLHVMLERMEWADNARLIKPHAVIGVMDGR